MRYPILELDLDELELPGPNGAKLILPKKYRGNELLKIGVLDRNGFREGFVWRYSPQDPSLAQVSIQLQWNRADITGIIDYMDDLVSSVTPVLGRKPKLLDTLGKLVADATCEEPDPNLSFEEQVLKRKGFVASSPFLKKPIGADFSPRLATAELLEIGHRLDLLRDILAGQKRAWAREMTSDGPKYEGGAAVAYERKFSLPGSRVDWYWIDVEEELP